MQVSQAHPQIAAERNEQVLLQTAKQLEASFLSEMLKSAGVGDPRTTLGGGAGEDHFSSLLVREYANSMVEAGGIGLAESIYESLVAEGS